MVFETFKSLGHGPSVKDLSCILNIFVGRTVSLPLSSSMKENSFDCSGFAVNPSLIGTAVNKYLPNKPGMV
jgi:hypothetical protein